jgi:hypothetical protein
MGRCPAAEIMPDRCTPEYEQVLAKMGALLPYRRASTVLSEFLPLGKPQTVETTRRRTLCVGARLEREAVASPASEPAEPAPSITLSIDGGHIRAARQYQGRTFEVLLAASPGPTHHVLDWFHLAMRFQHPAQAAKSWPSKTEDDRQAGKRLVETIERIRWRLWHGQVRRSLDLIGETAVKLESMEDGTVPVAAAQKVARLLRDLETYVSGQSEIVIDYAKARRCDEPISTAITESTVQWPLHRRMSAQQPMRWSPRGAHLMLKVRTTAVNETLDRDYAVAERWARRPFRNAA